MYEEDYQDGLNTPEKGDQRAAKSLVINTNHLYRRKQIRHLGRKRTGKV